MDPTLLAQLLALGGKDGDINSLLTSAKDDLGISKLQELLKKENLITPAASNAFSNLGSLLTVTGGMVNMSEAQNPESANIGTGAIGGAMQGISGGLPGILTGALMGMINSGQLRTDAEETERNRQKTILEGLRVLPTKMEEGGIVEADQDVLLPRQEEKGEVMLLPDGRIVDSMAKKTHKQMKDDEVTDIIPNGTYVFSNSKKKIIDLSKIKDDIFTYTVGDYKENEKSTPMEKITFGKIFGSKGKKTPAELVKQLRSRYPVKDDPKEVFEVDTNRENMRKRLELIMPIIQMQEGVYQKQSSLNPFKMEEGGLVSDGGGKDEKIVKNEKEMTRILKKKKSLMLDINYGADDNFSVTLRDERNNKITTYTLEDANPEYVLKVIGKNEYGGNTDKIKGNYSVITKIGPKKGSIRDDLYVILDIPFSDTDYHARESSYLSGGKRRISSLTGRGISPLEKRLMNEYPEEYKKQFPNSPLKVPSKGIYEVDENGKGNVNHLTDAYYRLKHKANSIRDVSVGSDGILRIQYNNKENGVSEIRVENATPDIIKKALGDGKDKGIIEKALPDFKSMKDTPKIASIRSNAIDGRVDTTPPVEDTTPPVEDTTPPVEDTTPPVEDTTSPVEDTTPEKKNKPNYSEIGYKLDREGYPVINDISDLKDVLSKVDAKRISDIPYSSYYTDGKIHFEDKDGNTGAVTIRKYYNHDKGDIGKFDALHEMTKDMGYNHGEYIIGRSRNQFVEKWGDSDINDTSSKQNNNHPIQKDKSVQDDTPLIDDGTPVDDSGNPIQPLPSTQEEGLNLPTVDSTTQGTNTESDRTLEDVLSSYDDIPWVQDYMNGNRNSDIYVEFDGGGRVMIFPSKVEVDGEIKELSKEDALKYALDNSTAIVEGEEGAKLVLDNMPASDTYKTYVFDDKGERHEYGKESIPSDLFNPQKLADRKAELSESFDERRSRLEETYKRNKQANLASFMSSLGAMGMQSTREDVPKFTSSFVNDKFPLIQESQIQKTLSKGAKNVGRMLASINQSGIDGSKLGSAISSMTSGILENETALRSSVLGQNQQQMANRYANLEQILQHNITKDAEQSNAERNNINRLIANIGSGTSSFISGNAKLRTSMDEQKSLLDQQHQEMLNSILAQEMQEKMMQNLTDTRTKEYQELIKRIGG